MLNHIELAKECERLRAENEALRKDAERYKYLRNQIRNPNIGDLWVAMGAIESGLSHWNGIDLDNQIDRAMKG